MSDKSKESAKSPRKRKADVALEPPADTKEDDKDGDAKPSPAKRAKKTKKASKSPTRSPGKKSPKKSPSKKSKAKAKDDGAGDVEMKTEDKANEKQEKEEPKEKTDEPAEEVTEKSTKAKKKGGRKAADFPMSLDQEEDFKAPPPVDHKVNANGTPLKIVCYNVNGIRAAADKNLQKYLNGENADIICLSEVKCTEDQNPLKMPGYHITWNAGTTKGYAGTAVFSKLKPLSVKTEIGVESSDKEGRCIALEFDNFWVVNTYQPNSGEGLKFASDRSAWDTAFMKFINGLNASKPVIWTGDLNVAHLQFDVYDGETNNKRKKTAGFTDLERLNFGKLIKCGFVDVYRHLHPTVKEDAYTFWSYRFNMRAKNQGWRLDYFVVSSSILPLVKSIQIAKSESSSDHCPLVLSITTP